MLRKKRLIVVGAGDFAPEVVWCISEVPPDRSDWQVAGFLDDKKDAAQRALRERGVPLPVLGGIAEYQPGADDRFICAIGDPKVKLALCERLRARGGVFVNIIHPTAGIGPGTSLGVGILVWRFVTISVNVRIGDFVTIGCHSSIGHDAVLQDGVTLSGHCDVTGHAHLERGVLLGTHAAILPGVRVGALATIGAGSVAFRNVAPEHTVVGVPAKVFI